MLARVASGQTSNAASDCDVTVLKVKSVVIEEDKIIAEASIRMAMITPEAESSGKSLRFTGRHFTRIKIKADKATFTVLRKGNGTDQDRHWKMSVAAAEALKAGREIGRIGFYSSSRSQTQDLQGNQSPRNNQDQTRST